MANNSGPNRNKIILNEDNNIITDDKEICEIFNKFFFISVADGVGFPDGLPANYNTKDGFQDIIGTHESHPSILEIKKNVLHTEDDFSFTHVNQSDVQKIMESLNTRKAHGFDGMPAKLLKLSAPILAGELSRLYTKALLWQISTTTLLSGSLHQDLVSVNWKKIQERALRFVLKDSVSCYDDLISKAKVDAFRVSAVK